MKLSEAIRLGAMLKPQGQIVPMYHGRTCAIGAALDAAGEIRGRWLTLRTKRAYDLWPELSEDAIHPLTGNSERMVRIIFKLNDVSRWSRERIADWVESLETTVPTMPNGTLNGDAVPVRPTAQLNVCSR